MKRAFNGLLVGGVLGIIVALAFGPSMVHWWYTPPSGAGGFSCEQPVQWALTKLFYLELGSAGVGALIGVVIMALRPAYKKPATPTGITPS